MSTNHRKIICVSVGGADLDIPDINELRGMGADIPEGAIYVAASILPCADDYHWNHDVIGIKFEHPDYPPTECGQQIPVQHIGH